MRATRFTVGCLRLVVRGLSATLATRVRLVIALLVLIIALPLDFSWEAQGCSVHVYPWRFAWY